MVGRWEINGNGRKAREGQKNRESCDRRLAFLGDACVAPLALTQMAAALFSNTYLDETSTRIRSKPVPWEVCAYIGWKHLMLNVHAQGYQRAELITPEESALIKKVDRQPKAKVESLLLSEGPTYAVLYLNLLKKLQRVDTMQCLLVLITDALLGAHHPGLT